jgi:hypothetical protein
MRVRPLGHGPLSLGPGWPANASEHRLDGDARTATCRQDGGRQGGHVDSAARVQGAHQLLDRHGSERRDFRHGDLFAAVVVVHT